MATIKDVARLAGVSPAAVSRHLNGRISLPEGTRTRIDSAIAELDYRPNLLAKRLSTGRTEAISLVTPEIDNPFFAELAANCEDAAARAGYSVYITSTRGDAEREIAAIARLRDQHVDGMIFMTNHADDGRLLRALSGLRNVVLVDEDVPGACQPRIFVENESGARAAVDHLIALGHRDIWLIGGSIGTHSSGEREAGWRHALREAGLSPGHAISGSYHRDHGRAAARQLLSLPAGDRPTALLAGSDEIALGLIEVFRDAGLRVPQDISIVGYDETPFSGLIAPALTTVRQPVAEIGQQAFETLHALIEGQEVAPETRFPVSLIVRGSTAPPPQG